MQTTTIIIKPIKYILPILELITFTHRLIRYDKDIFIINDSEILINNNYAKSKIRKYKTGLISYLTKVDVLNEL